MLRKDIFLFEEAGLIRTNLAWLQAHQALMRGFNVELTASTEAYLKAARAHGDPSRLSAFFTKLLRGGLADMLSCKLSAACC